jgi:hypothetical protein
MPLAAPVTNATFPAKFPVRFVAIVDSIGHPIMSSVE